MRGVVFRAASHSSPATNLFDRDTLDTERKLLHFDLGVGQRVGS